MGRSRTFSGTGYPRAEDVQATYVALVGLRAGEQPVTITELRGAAPDVPDAKVRLLRANLVGALEEIAARHKEHHVTDRGKLEHMIEYGQTARCRWKVLLEYFKHDVPWERCGTCDNCRQLLERSVRPAAERTEAADWEKERVLTCSDRPLTEGVTISLRNAYASGDSHRPHPRGGTGARGAARPQPCALLRLRPRVPHSRGRGRRV